MANVSYVSGAVLLDRVRNLGPAESLHVSVSDGLLVAGTNPVAPDFYFDFDTERFEPLKAAARARKDNVRDMPIIDAVELDTGRATGLYTVEVRGKARSYKNLKQALRETVLLLSENDDLFLENVARERARTRGLVSRNRDALFDNRHLAEKHAERLSNGWWLNTNNSTEQVKRWLRVMARHAGLAWNQDIRISF